MPFHPTCCEGMNKTESTTAQLAEALDELRAAEAELEAGKVGAADQSRD